MFKHINKYLIKVEFNINSEPDSKSDILKKSKDINDLAIKLHDIIETPLAKIESFFKKYNIKIV